MAIYTIADLHLSFSEDKPMSIFGENWEGHSEKIKNNWINKVKQEDTVVLVGDFSWSMYLEDTYKDFKFLNQLPGKKILLKGNHDYWWTTLTINSKVSILWHSAFFIVQLSHPYMTTGKTTALTRQIFVGKIVSLLFNMLSRLVITFSSKATVHVVAESDATEHTHTQQT